MWLRHKLEELNQLSATNARVEAVAIKLVVQNDNMRKVTIYPTNSLDISVEYIEGVTEPSGTRKVTAITFNHDQILIDFDNGDFRRFNGFRGILDEHDETKTTK